MNSRSPAAIVTGASGFIGSWCAAHLAREGWTVVGLDRNPVDTSSPARPEYADFAMVDLDSPDKVRSMIERYDPCAIIHTAGPASVEHSFADPYADLIGQMQPWLSVLEAIRLSTSPAAAILCSTAAVYGNPDQLPVREDSKLAPISPYGFHKLQKELLLREYVALHGVKGSIARIFSTYGPGLRRLAVWDIARRMMGGDYHIQGTGQETRDYLYIEDVAAAIARIAAGAPHNGTAYNVASGTETKILDLAVMLGHELGLDRIAIAGSLETHATKGKPLRWCADMAALQALGQDDTTSLGTGIARTVAWIRSL